jgi:uncharacterized membrane-anchored protein
VSDARTTAPEEWDMRVMTAFRITRSCGRVNFASFLRNLLHHFWYAYKAMATVAYQREEVFYFEAIIVRVRPGVALCDIVRLN